MLEGSLAWVGFYVCVKRGAAEEEQGARHALQYYTVQFHVLKLLLGAVSW